MTPRHTLRDLFSSFLVIAALSLPTLASSRAAADVIPMDVTACDMHGVGAACMDTMGAGTCQSSRCTRLDYASWDRDASVSPPSVEYDCVRCIVGPAPDGGSRDGGVLTARPTASCSTLGVGSSGAWSFGALLALAFLARRRR